jgi:hypothetical protein
VFGRLAKRLKVNCTSRELVRRCFRPKAVVKSEDGQCETQTGDGTAKYWVRLNPELWSVLNQKGVV